MISINTSIVNTAIKKFDSEIESYSNKAISRLTSLSNDVSLDSFKHGYIKRLLKELENKKIMSLSIKEIEDLKKKMDEVAPTKRNFKSLADKIIECLGYNEIRTDFLPKFFNEIGIKACVYCNSQHTLNIKVDTYTKKGEKKKERKWVAKYQVDHSFSQGDFPYLSICLFNFIPSCATCNNIKRKKKIDFKLYQDQVIDNGFLFSLNEASKDLYIVNFDKEELIIEFYDPIKKDSISSVPQSFEDSFHISKLYNTQKDLAEELLLKAIIYNKEYKQTLFDNFKKAIPRPELFNRFLVGNYTEPEEIHKRPMAKFMQDIAKDVGLI
jgi:hypothetical protein